jgi:hypothetical protein
VIANSKFESVLARSGILMRRRVSEIGDLPISKIPIPFGELNIIVKTVHRINGAIKELYWFAEAGIQFRNAGISWKYIAEEKIKIPKRQFPVAGYQMSAYFEAVNPQYTIGLPLKIF